MPRDIEKQKASWRRYYHRNKDKIKKSIAKRIELQQKEIRKLKEETPCADCGKCFPYYVMDFDHVRGTKYKNVGNLITTGTRRKLYIEIEKCELVCANCHRVRTHGEGSSIGQSV